MRRSLGIVFVLMLLGLGVSCRAQTRLSFDQNLDKNPNIRHDLCEKELPSSIDASLHADSLHAGHAWPLACAELDLDLEKSEFARLRDQAEKGTSFESEAYVTLLRAFDNYKKLHLDLDKRECGAGNGCGVAMAQDEAQINYEFLLMAEGFRGAGLPSFSARAAEDANRQLDKAFQLQLPSFPVLCPHTDDKENDFFCPPQSEFQEMEGAWIRYRERWVFYGAIKWPKVSEDSWRAYLTLQHMNPPGSSPGIR